MRVARHFTPTRSVEEAHGPECGSCVTLHGAAAVPIGRWRLGSAVSRWPASLRGGLYLSVRFRHSSSEANIRGHADPPGRKRRFLPQKNKLKAT